MIYDNMINHATTKGDKTSAVQGPTARFISYFTF